MSLAMEAPLGQGEEGFRPRYDLDQSELDVLDQQIVASVRGIYPEEGVYSALIAPDHPFSNFVRGQEAKFFPEVNEFPAEEEENTLLFALVDTRLESSRVVHVGTISSPGLMRTEAHPDSTGFLFVDELVGLGNFTPEDFRAYYESRGLKLDKCIAVETNIRVGEPVEKYHGFRTVDLGYLTLFGLVERSNPEPGESAVFASINRASAVSFGRVGIECEPLMGRDDMVTPESFYGRRSTPVAIPYTDIFKAMGPQLPSVSFGVEEA
ncbi:MAG TPA: hypothetical protein VFT16_05880 [Candidatus Saccharimonadales bacterium]|nr:hypothetical protein [Candidatus Saccharimonadales bacterium]